MSESGARVEPVGVLAPVPLPLDDAGAVAREPLEAWLEELHPVDGVAACASDGDPGEYADLDTADWRATVEHLVRLSPRPAWIGVGHPDPEEVLTRAAFADSLAPAGIVAPLEREDPVTAALPLTRSAPKSPLFLAEVSGPPLAADELARLREALPELAGLVLVGRDEDGYDELRPFAEELDLLCPDTELTTGGRRSASGTLSAAACLSPQVVSLWFEELERDPVAAQERERRWQRFVEDRLHHLRERYRLDRAGLDKALAVAGGLFPGTTRMRPGREALPAEAAHVLGRYAARAGWIEES